MRPSPNLPRLLLLTTALLLIAPPATAAYAPNVDEDGLALEPVPIIRGNVTVVNHKPTCSTDVLCFEEDSTLKQTSLATYGVELATDRVAEPIQFQPQKVDVQYYGEDPTTATTKATTSAWGANVSDKAWLDTTNWATSGAEGNETFEMIRHSTNAHVLHFKNPGTNPGTIEADTYTFDFLDLTTDPTKYRLVMGVEIVTNSNAVEFNAYDTNGTGMETFAFSGDVNEKATGPSTLANGTGVTFWDPLVTDGTNTMGGVTHGVGKISIVIYANSATGPTEVYVYALAVQVKRFEFGLDEDGTPVYNMTYVGCDGVARSGPLGYTCLTTFQPSFSYQVVRDLKLAYMLPATSLSESSIMVSEQDPESVDFPWKMNYRFTFLLPQRIDLSWAGDETYHYTLGVAGKQHLLLKVGGLDKLKDVEKRVATTEVTLGPPTIGKDANGKDRTSEVEFTIQFTDAQMMDVTEVGLLGLPADHWLSRTWGFFAGLAGIGFLFARLQRRRRKTP